MRVRSHHARVRRLSCRHSFLLGGVGRGSHGPLLDVLYHLHGSDDVRSGRRPPSSERRRSTSRPPSWRAHRLGASPSHWHHVYRHLCASDRAIHVPPKQAATRARARAERRARPARHRRGLPCAARGMETTALHHIITSVRPTCAQDACDGRFDGPADDTPQSEDASMIAALALGQLVRYSVGAPCGVRLTPLMLFFLLRLASPESRRREGHA